MELVSFTVRNSVSGTERYGNNATNGTESVNGTERYGTQVIRQTVHSSVRNSTERSGTAFG